jgi:cyclic beta-1,2-glucan synthetase
VSLSTGRAFLQRFNFFSPSKTLEAPIRAELFSLDRLEQHAESLAAAHHLAPKHPRGRQLLPRVKDNKRHLVAAYRSIAQDIQDDRAITPASEWLVDNFHVVEEQIREIIDDLPPGFYRELPKLAEGHLEGCPRVVGVAWAFVAHTDSRFDPDWLRRFVRAYQRKDPLSIGEIWAIAISLRIVLVENLRRLADRIVASKEGRRQADALADAWLGSKSTLSLDPSSMPHDAQNTPISRAFAVQLVQRLRDQESRVAPILQWLDQRLAAQETNAEDIVRLEHHEQTAMNTTVRNVILSMKLLSAMDWAQFFEDVSSVDELLRNGSAFADMDFPTRDRYRHAIEDLSRHSNQSEMAVAQKALEFTQHGTPGSGTMDRENARRSDPGFYLISGGRDAIEEALHYRSTLRRKLLRFYMARATPAYLGSLLVVTAGALAFPVHASVRSGMTHPLLALFILLGVIPASDLAVAFVNWCVTDAITPKTLPKLDFLYGVPDTLATLIVMPTLLTTHEIVDEHLERLEIHYLSNPEGALQFALLTDWTDADQEHRPEDDALLTHVRTGIERLNERYGPSATDQAPRFFALHRRRLWNDSEGVWMGWERKRGKLRELNRLLRGTTNTTFMDPPVFSRKIHYVITLDADTRLPRGAAYRLVGAMAHPLNRPRFDPAAGRVVEGYGIMQPRITPSLPITGFGSLYQKIYSGPAGLDPYSFAVSDVYQDLFKEGSFVGKGIYDVDAFETALADRVPDNIMLSHDLYEGLFARTALVTDVELFEEFPSHYEVATARAHRWVRGDWQLLPLMFGPLTLIGRWKMLDNLRRSMSPICAYLTLLTAWVLPVTGANGLWIRFILATIAFPSLIPVLADLLPRGRPLSVANHLRETWSDLKLALSHIVLAIGFLAHQAWVMTDAIVRTLYRLLITRRHRLEWTSAALSKNLIDIQPVAFYRRMKSALILALLPLGLVYVAHAVSAWPNVIPFALLWLLAPGVAQRLSRPLEETDIRPLSAEDRQFFRSIGRKTWRFFETFVTVEHHFLPPDNFQEIPQPVIAHRTSPTNIGLYLLSIVSARSFGWIGAADMLERIENTLGTVQTLKRHQGHLYNWYDTLDMRELAPLYISTVDSGNFAGHVWALANACRALAERPLDRSQMVPGLRDTLNLLRATAKEMAEDRRAEIVTSAQFGASVDAFQHRLSLMPQSPADWAPTLAALEAQALTLVDMAHTLKNAEVQSWCDLLVRQIRSHQRDAGQDDLLPPELVERLLNAARTCDQLVQEMRFGFLCDPVKKIFSIGFQVSEQKLDVSCYDLLASEARLASFVAIAKGDVPALHWFHLSRALVPAGGGIALLSWSGSMFEYLMPALVMHAPAGSLLDQTHRNVVRRQMEYGAERHVPWGVSESGYNAQDLEFTYQYSNFGVPGLGLKRGLANDILVAPYATGLAAMIDPADAAQNFHRLSGIGAEGPYGFYEALDYTATRLPENQTVAVVQEYMAHHQGMTLVSLANVLYDGVIRSYFHAEPRVQATELLLQERTPRAIPVKPVRTDDGRSDVRSLVPLVLRRFHSPHDVIPRTHLLSNGRYSVMITAAGSGYSRWNDLAITRWREDSTRDSWGTYIFLRDVKSGAIWSAGYQPSGAEPDAYEVDFSEDRAEIVRRDGSIFTTLEVVVSPEDDAEIRRVTLKNIGETGRDIEVTSYAELVLAPPAADQAHPAFSNLFVQTEFIPEVNGLIGTRRPRSPDEAAVWAGHVVVVDGDTVGEVQYESDRARFLGRGRGIRTPICIIDGKPLSNTAGAVLDPMVSLRRRVHLKPGETVRVTFSTMIAATREKVLELADKYHDLAMFERTVTLAWTQAHIQQHHLSLEPSEVHLFQDIASRIIYSDEGLRPVPEVMKRNTRGAPGLWAYGISGDIPIVLVRIDEEDDKQIVRELLRAHEYWRLKNLAVDLIILNEKSHSYAQELQIILETLVRTNQDILRHETHAKHGDIFVLRLDRLSPEDRVLLQSAARVIFLSRHGTLAQQMERLEPSPEMEEAFPSGRLPKAVERLKAQAETLKDFFAGTSPEPLTSSAQDGGKELQFFNGLGGFSEDGRDYVITLNPGQWTPAPWINVIANPQFGFQVSESGSGYTWSMNSRENQLTPWSNDPVTDPTGETFYIRDEETGDLWTPTALPIREENSAYRARHGQGYSRFDHTSHGIASDLLQFVPIADPVKISLLRLTNTSKRSRRLSVTAYVEWVLGTARPMSAPFVITEIDERTGAIFARNPWNTEFGERTAFADLLGHQVSGTSDRTEFIGRNGTLAHPAALETGSPLSGRIGPGLDPCAALQESVELRPGASVDIVFILGQAANRDSATALIQKYRQVTIENEFRAVQIQWENNLDAVQVRTPDRSMDLMLNRWLLYQTLGCRLWARAAFYQAGGAYGFRDQLQDVMALMVSRRDLAREHILRAAARQFKEGDVQHWWHPPTGRGVRTHISDDRVWLAYVVQHYLDVTGDASILEESIPFLDGQAIPAGREDAYFHPGTSADHATLFEHCARALDCSLSVGTHGLPLMGSGDWNDGMNRVGAEGRGESIWLAWFLHTTLWEFAKVAEARGETVRAETWRLHVGELKAALERHGWDGEWYRRAYFDDGSPLGSGTNQECQIDSIAQSWSVLSGAADPARAARAMNALERRLLLPADGLALLFTPPFNHTTPNPGYIQGYLPGVRENGGQYTHAAVWAVNAFAALGDGDRAGRLFSMLNPVNHGNTRAAIQRYKVEPYVAAGDVYAVAPHTGRGGWSWYTGSAGWMYRAGLEWILGFRLRGTTLMMDPCIPRDWPGFELSFRYHAARYDVTVENPKHVSRGIHSVEVDGKPVRGGAAIYLTDDKMTHQIRIVLG